MAAAAVLKTAGRKSVWVRVPSPAARPRSQLLRQVDSTPRSRGDSDRAGKPRPRGPMRRSRVVLHPIAPVLRLRPAQPSGRWPPVESLGKGGGHIPESYTYAIGPQARKVECVLRSDSAGDRTHALQIGRVLGSLPRFHAGGREWSRPDAQPGQGRLDSTPWVARNGADSEYR